MTDATLMHSFLCDLRLSKLFDVLAFTKNYVSFSLRRFRKDVLAHLPAMAGAHMGAKVAIVEAPAFYFYDH